MRIHDFGVEKEDFNLVPNEIKLNIYEKIYRSRKCEEYVMYCVNNKFINYPVYLSMGQESIPAAVIEAVGNKHHVFTQHRCHSTFLSLGGDVLKLRDELLGLPTGCSGGKAGSNCLQIHENEIKMYGHHGLIGENVPQAVGACLGSNEPTLCFVGDGAIEEDYIYPAIGFAVTHNLPIIFICEDNDLSILTKTKERRNWEITNIIEALDIPTVNLADDPWSVYIKIKELLAKTDGPIFMNIKTCRGRWHVGTGTDDMAEWDRFSIVKKELINLNLENEIKNIEEKADKEMENVWNPKILQQLLEK